ncbi:DUF3054 domain-containing protein [Luteococcus sp. H138]|uniref:DUF3054 domain-containing protein n=1 Tax=unclassified Luteococcus TaxID=2639923 RepID=UPI00313B3E6F
MTKQVVLAIDLALVVLFSIIGVLSHSESLLSRLIPVVWPFLVACAIAWLIMLWRKRPVGTLGAGVFVWLVTAWGGLALRAATGGGTQTAFIVVTTVVTGLFLVGWRLLLSKKLTA